jgi:protein-tyrosine phosphatase
VIDIHTHIIPALDDGPGDMETSIAMGRIFAEEGVTTVISTSHSEEAMVLGREVMQRKLKEVQAAWVEAGIEIETELGVEIFLRPTAVQDLQSGRAWTLAGSQYVLVELPYEPWPAYADQALFDLRVAGYVPILAHPERYTAIQQDPNRMYALAERGVLGQVTADALLGRHGGSIKRCAQTLVRHRLVQFLSSDAHGVVAGKRPPLLREALRVAERLVGPEAAHLLVYENPAHILANASLTPNSEPIRTSESWLSRFFRPSS